MNEKENREQVQESSPANSHKRDHVPPKVAVYDRPERKMPFSWQFVILAVLLLIAAVVVYQFVF